MDVVQIGQVVESLRREVGLTQAELAARIGTTQAAISKIETGRTRPGLELLDRIARGVGREMTITLGEESRPIPAKERRRRARKVLGDFDPWDRDPSTAERDTFLRTRESLGACRGRAVPDRRHSPFARRALPRRNGPIGR